MNDAAPKLIITPQRVSTLKKRSDFLRLRKGRYHHTPHFILQSKRIEDDTSSNTIIRTGYTVTTKTGNSVERSRIKRRLREAVQQIFPDQAKHGFDYVLIAKRPSLTGNFTTILKDLSLALDRVHANKANGDKRRNSDTKSSKIAQDLTDGH